MAGIARHLGDLGGGELGDRHLVGIDAGFGQDHAQQRDVGLGPADDADAMSGEIAELLDLRRRRLLRALGRKAADRPQHHDVLAQDGDRLGVGRQIQIAARDRKVGLVGRQQCDALDRAVGGDRVQPHRAAVAGKGLRQRLHQFLVVAAGRADRDAQGDGLQDVIEPGGGGAEQEDAGSQHQQRIVLPLAASGRRVRGIAGIRMMTLSGHATRKPEPGAKNGKQALRPPGVPAMSGRRAGSIMRKQKPAGAAGGPSNSFSDRSGRLLHPGRRQVDRLAGL